MDNKKQNQSRSGKLGLLVVAGLLLVSLAANGMMGWAIISNRPTIGAVCGESVIAEHNKIMDDKAQSDYKTVLKNNAAKIKAIKNYEKDVNCVAILTISDMFLDDSSDMNKNVSILNSFINKGQNPSLKIKNIQSYYTFKDAIEIIKSPRSNTMQGIGRG